MTNPLAPNADPVLIVPWFWIGDFVRVHSVVTLLRAEMPERPVDILATPLTAPLADYMPGVRQAIVSDLPRGRLALKKQFALADRLRQERYGRALVMPRTWKSALAPWLAHIPVRTGFAGEFRYGLINDLRPGERDLARMIDQMGTIALPSGVTRASEWPLPKLNVPSQDVAAWRALHGVVPDGRSVIALAPGAVGAGKAWPVGHYVELARTLTKDKMSIWVIGGPSETVLAKQIAQAGAHVHDLTSNDLRNAILALAGANVAVTNDSGLMHIAAAIDTPTIAIFGPTSPWHWKPLNPLAAILEPPLDAATAERVKTEGNRAVAYRRTDDVSVNTVAKTVQEVLAKLKH
ncbi:MAG: lipopolysaccharide heptosyltransferase II [Pseudolabrys sp.]|nr:lipopolysaccharide heptosyltransferase II [Pseudolabrys sp.]MBV9259920.1 lipopolysaccharide heptosyltransferase II [Pseudolabrys sp.]